MPKKRKIVRSQLHHFVLILIITVLAYWLTLGMYFWNDDNAIIFKLQNLNEGVGNLGSGILGLDSPYRMVIFTLIPIYYFFGINPVAFFSYGLLFYFFAAIAVYFFSKSFLKDNRLALVSSLIFASGYVGAETLWRVYNSVHTSITIIYIVAFCTFYNYFIDQRNLARKLLYYFVALIFFILALQWGFVRAHGLIIVVIAQEVLFNFNLRYSVFRLAPFLYLAYIWYFAGSSNTKHLDFLVSRIAENYEWQLLLVPLQTLKNIIIPDAINFPLVLFLAILILIVWKFRSRILFFSLIFMVSGYMTYFMIYHDQVLNSTHRYLTTSLAGLGIFFAFLFSRILKSQKYLYLASGLIIAINLLLVNWTQYQILINRSIPTKSFYQVMRKEIPTLNRNSAILFNVKDDLKSKQEFESFFGVGSMPNSTAIAIYYGLDRYDVYLPQDFEELAQNIKTKKINKEDAYMFFYSQESGLVNTTEIFRQSVWGKLGSFEISNPKKINKQYAAPIKIRLSIEAKTVEAGNPNEIKEIEKYLNYFKSQNRYYDLVSATSDSHWENLTIDNIIDQNYSTSWMGSRGTWHDGKKENIFLDLGEVKQIGAIKLSFGAVDKAPIKYIYSCSQDNKNWNDWNATYAQPKQHAEKKVDVLTAKNCQYIKIHIEQTKGDSPEIAEIEVVEDEYKNLNFITAQKYQNDLGALLSSNQKDLILEFLKEYGLVAEICFITDEFDELTDKVRGKNCQKKRVMIGEKNNLEFTVPQSGTVLKKIIIPPQQNINFKISEITGENILFTNLNQNEN